MRQMANSAVGLRAGWTSGGRSILVAFLSGGCQFHDSDEDDGKRPQILNAIERKKPQAVASDQDQAG